MQSNNSNKSSINPSSTQLKRSALSLLLLCSVGFSACGIDHRPQYKNKTFGRVATPEAPELPVIEPPQGETPKEPIVPKPDPVIEPEDPRDPPPQPEPPINEVLGHYSFMGYFNLETVHRITKGNGHQDGRVTSGGTLDNIIAELLAFVLGPDPEERLSMQVTMTGEDSSVIKQFGKTEGGDRISELKGEESQSGTQLLDWVMPNDEKSVDCPTPFICIKRMVWQPQTGKPLTYCYRDMASKKTALIPYSANPHFSTEAFQRAIGRGIQSRPIEVVKLDGIVSCEDEDTIVRDVKPVVYNVSLGSLLDQNAPKFMRVATFTRLFANVEIILKFSLYNPDTGKLYVPSKGPYIDQLTRLNSKMRFFINNTENVIVKIEQTIQQELRTEDPETVIRNIARKYGTGAAKLARLALVFDRDTQGIQLVHSFEFCTHLDVIQNPYNHCTGRFQR